MVLLVLPMTLLAWSILMWRDPEETSSLAQTIANNAVPLYVFSLIPGVLLSVLHTKALGTRHENGGSDFYLKSALIGALTGTMLAVMLSIALFRTLNPALWQMWLWGAMMGLLYGGIRARIER